MSTSVSVTSAAPATLGNSDTRPAPSPRAPNSRREIPGFSPYAIVSAIECSSHMSLSRVKRRVCSTQRILLHLTHRVPRQLGGEQHAPGDLVAREARSQRLDDPLLREC